MFVKEGRDDKAMKKVLQSIIDIVQCPLTWSVLKG